MKPIGYLLLWGVSLGCWAACYPYHSEVIGEIQTVSVTKGDTLPTLAKRYDVGYDALWQANPQLQFHSLFLGMQVILPTQHLLPKTAHKGIVVNVAEKRLYFFKNPSTVCTYPVSIGQKEWPTPLGVFTITQQIKNPSWHVPASIRAAEKKLGKMLPKVVKPGPDNPLGSRALRLSRRNYLIHGNNDPVSIGSSSSAGCLRLYEKDIQELYRWVQVGGSVKIINQPLKQRMIKQHLWVEVHPKLDDIYGPSKEKSIAYHISNINKQWLQKVMTLHSGMPIVIGTVKS